jgi:hypothetical protein
MSVEEILLSSLSQRAHVKEMVMKRSTAGSKIRGP